MWSTYKICGIIINQSIKSDKMEITFDQAVELLEIVDINKIKTGDIPRIKKKAKKRWHPDKVAHQGDEALTQEYNIKFQQIEVACELIESYLDGTLKTGEAFTKKDKTTYRKPTEIIRENAVDLQFKLKSVWHLVKTYNYKFSQQEVLISDGFKLKDLLEEDFKEDIAMSSIVSFFYGFIQFGISSVFVLFLVSKAPVLSYLVGGVFFTSIFLHILSCILGFLPLSRFWLPYMVQDFMIKFINFGLILYQWAEKEYGHSSNIWVILLIRIPVIFAQLIKYLILFPLYQLAKIFVGDKIVGVTKQKVNYYADAADWYIESLINKPPHSMSDDELFHLSYIYTELSDVEVEIVKNGWEQEVDKDVKKESTFSKQRDSSIVDTSDSNSELGNSVIYKKGKNLVGEITIVLTTFFNQLYLGIKPLLKTKLIPIIGLVTLVLIFSFYYLPTTWNEKEYSTEKSKIGSTNEEKVYLAKEKLSKILEKDLEGKLNLLSFTETQLSNFTSEVSETEYIRLEFEAELEIKDALKLGERLNLHENTYRNSQLKQYNKGDKIIYQGYFDIERHDEISKLYATISNWNQDTFEKELSSNINEKELSKNISKKESYSEVTDNENSIPVPSTTEKTGYINANEVNVRASAITSLDNVITKLDKSTSVKILDVIEGVNSSKKFSCKSQATFYSNGKRMKLNAGKTVTYQRKSTSKKGYYVVTTIVGGKRLTGYIDSSNLDRLNAKWYKVDYGDGEGFINGNYISI